MSSTTLGIAEFMAQSAGEEVGEPIFRAINVDGRRRAVRLEREFWTGAEELIKSEGIKLSDLIRLAASSGLSETNLSSAVRQIILKWSRVRLSEIKQRSGSAGIAHIVAACPSPVFALSVRKKLRFHNAAFINYIRSSIQFDDIEDIGRQLKLQIDIPVDELFRRLTDSGGEPQIVGFAIGIRERRLRGRIQTVIAPCWDDDMILSYVVT